eukprot:7255155-Ditylum_brightwellii.AAC.1
MKKVSTAPPTSKHRIRELLNVSNEIVKGQNKSSHSASNASSIDSDTPPLMAASLTRMMMIG